jgi:hypothetical protein
LSLDSDESVEPDLRRSIDGALASPVADGYRMNRKVYYRDRPLNFAWQPEYRLRLVRRGAACWTGLDPHDSLELVRPGPAPLLAGTLRHDSIGWFSDFLVKQAVHARTMARSMHREGRRGSRWRLVASPAGAFLKQIVVKQAWRDGWPGWLAAASTAAGALMKHAVLLEISRSGRSESA